MEAISNSAAVTTTEQIPRGLTSAEAEERLEEFGPNDPTPPQRHSIFAELLLLFVNPLVVILLIAAIISGFIGQLLDASG